MGAVDDLWLLSALWKRSASALREALFKGRGALSPEAMRFGENSDCKS
jgi:hypothetical protein